MDDFDPLREGQLVQLRSNAARRGASTGKSKKAGTRTYVQVEFGRQERTYIDVLDLESQQVGGDDFPDLLRKMRFGRIGNLARVLTFHKIASRVSNVFYAMQASRTDFYAYQFKPVYKFIESTNGRILITDEVGLGKTIEAGLIWLEAQARSGARRLLVVCPSMLREKWKQELRFRFNVDAEIYDSSGFIDLLRDFEREADNFQCAAVCSIQSLRTAKVLDALTEFEETGYTFDLVVIDEAHHLRNVDTRSHKLGRQLSDLTEALVLLTATPIHLRSEDLFRLLSLLDPDEFAHQWVFSNRIAANEPLVFAQNALRRHPADVAEALDHLERLPESRWFAGNPLVDLAIGKVASLDPGDTRGLVDTGRLLESLNLLASTVSRTRKREVHDWRVIREPSVYNVTFTDRELEFYNAVTAAVRAQVRELGLEGIAAFALMMPQRQMASCIPAMVRHYRENNSDLLDRELLEDDFGYWSDTDDQDGAASIESPTLRSIVDGWPADWVDSKYEVLRAQLQALFEREPDTKIIIFSYFKRTLAYLQDRLKDDGFGTVLISGDVPMKLPDADERPDRTKIIKRFRQSPDLRILLSSEVGSEGIDLQFCRVVINYDLPWNPMKVEQRIGRVDRLGQKAAKISIVNFAVHGTIEQKILTRLYNRIGIFQRNIGDLEPILGSEIHDLTVYLLSGDLSEEQVDARIRQSQLAIEAKRQIESELEDQSAVFFGTADFILEQINQARSMGRWITPEDVRAFTSDFFAGAYRGTRLVWDHPAPGLVSIDLSSNARTDFSYFWRHRGSTPPTSLARATSEPCVLAYTADAAKEDSRLEHLSHFHPLVAWIVDVYRGKDDVFFPSSAVEVSTDRVPPGIYVFAVELWTFVAGTSSPGEVRMAYALARVDGEIEETGQAAEQLVQEILGHGADWRTADQECDAGALEDALRTCAASLTRDREKAFAEFQTRSTATAYRQKAQLESFLGRKSETIRSTIDSLKRRNAPEHRVRGFQTRLANLETSVRAKVRDVEAKSRCTLEFKDVAGGVCRVRTIGKRR